MADKLVVRRYKVTETQAGMIEQIALDFRRKTKTKYDPDAVLRGIIDFYLERQPKTSKRKLDHMVQAEVKRWHRLGWSQRTIAKYLGVSRGAVVYALKH